MIYFIFSLSLSTSQSRYILLPHSSASNIPSSLPLGKTNVLFRDFYQQASVVLKQHLSLFRLDIKTKEKNGLLTLLLFHFPASFRATALSSENQSFEKAGSRSTSSKDPLTISECLALINDLDYLLTLEPAQSGSVLDISSINRDAMAACLFTGVESYVRAREAIFPDSNNAHINTHVKTDINIDVDVAKVWKDCEKVNMAPVVPSGENFMISYEIGIQANPSSFEMNFLHSAEAPLSHKLLLAAYFRVTSEGATIRYAFTSLLTSIAHESVHFLQTYLGQLQKDQLIANSNSNDVLWSAEFDASVISYSIFAHVRILQLEWSTIFLINEHNFELHNLTEHSSRFVQKTRTYNHILLFILTAESICKEERRLFAKRSKGYEKMRQA